MITSAEQFVALRESELKDEYDRAAMDEAPLAVWRDIISRYPEHRRWVVHNKSVPLEILEELSAGDAMVRYFIASKRKLSPALFERLSRDESESVRTAIACNAKTPRAILERLLDDADQSVARAALYHWEQKGGKLRK